MVADERNRAEVPAQKADTPEITGFAGTGIKLIRVMEDAEEQPFELVKTTLYEPESDTTRDRFVPAGADTATPLIYH